ncbi:LysM peptidoglycan-binding domain-containing protein [Chryseolinea lacunae]|uniref:LysM peptidoglycan-binding domain-containing protein n=1 Tax=Chryseolinea lacunae TaxID=2801331 RepID=A0ABS1KTR6_9BACT|nr:LysM peptidoglycan-binding domain-containing protein [Chryseolinea lacunae]MBL0742811.1 LysM peptidoglycan-binding domain-containing protein [Chryseolinea lacunae]
MINELILAGVSFFHPHVQQKDSIGTETINGKIFVLHQVGEKETLYAISKRYGATVDAIVQANPGADAGLEIGQVLKVPYTPKATAPRKADGTTHVVAAKETMFSIARQYGITVDELKQWNNLTDNNLSIGQEIVVKKGATPRPVTPTQPHTTATITVTPTHKGTHVVAAKETMFSISKQYGITVQQLKDWNKLEGNEISIGQELQVAAPTGTAEVKVTQPPVAEVKKDPIKEPEIKKEPEAKTEIKTVTPVVVAPPKKETTPAPSITISESVKNSDEIVQTGLAELIEGTDGNRKYLALHRTAPVGTILKVKNEMNNREVFVRVMGKLPDTALTDKLVIRISKSAYDRLGAIDPKFRVEVTYYK